MIIDIWDWGEGVEHNCLLSIGRDGDNVGEIEMSE